ncbi:ABC transporter permease [Serpentinicella sp. ANB-PHB4]|uniref:ABC transporter permease n=1 Tax=Serpentinicella sp. ANB-PHB4 TaxID=3074076 RepID=UPI00285966D0|nr:ABC transporter permease [Serpentinicella sp. ANB-PHB4]MDR5659969.1 ABC transporter permease [Serpentinicella sp. ANB-PHB4]
MAKLKSPIAKNSRQDKLIPFLSVILGFAVGALIMLVSGFNSFAAYTRLLEGAGLFGNVRRLGGTLLNMTPLILTGLSVAFGMRTGLFNIGASGQMLMGGFGAVAVGILFELPKVIHLPLAVVTALILGALWGMVPGILKSKFNVHEVVVTIMMNWIAVWTVYYFVPLYIRGAFDTESATIRSTASLRTEWLSDLFNGSPVNLGLFIAIAAAIAVWWILEKTTFGYELKAVGLNKDAAKYAGIHVDRNIIFSMMISGALAGLAGATFYLGFTNNIKIGELPMLGFDGIAVALLGMNTPLGVVLSAFLFGFMNAGKGFMQAATGVPNELVQVIMAVIIFFSAATMLIRRWMNHLSKRKEKTQKNLEKGGAQ